MVHQDDHVKTQEKKKKTNKPKLMSAVEPSDYANSLTNQIRMNTPFIENHLQGSQVEALGKPGISNSQQRALTHCIGKQQGNRQLQRLISNLGNGKQSAYVQRAEPITATVAGLGLSAASFAISVLPSPGGGFDYQDVLVSRSRPEAPSKLNPVKIPLLRLWAHIAAGSSDAMWNLTLDTDGDSILSAHTGFELINGFEGGIFGSTGRVSWSATPSGGKYASPTNILLKCQGFLNPSGPGKCDFKAVYIVSGDGTVTPRSCNVTNVSGNVAFTFNWKSWKKSGLFIGNMERGESEKLESEHAKGLGLPEPKEVGDIPLPSIAFFKVGSAALKENEERKVVHWYMALPRPIRYRIEAGLLPIMLEGYASTTHTGSYNRILSRRRVQRVQAILEDIAGSKARFVTHAYGKYKAKSRKHTEVRFERRVFISVLGY